MSGTTTSMSLQDRMSGPLSKILKAMDSTIRVMEQMDQASDRLDNKTLANARRNISNASAEFERMKSSMDSTADSSNKLATQQEKMNNALNRMKPPTILERMRSLYSNVSKEIAQATTTQAKFAVVLNKLKPTNVLEKLKTVMKQHGDNSDKASRQQDRFNHSVHGGIAGIKSMAAGLLAAIGAYRAFGAVKNVLTDMFKQGVNFHAFKQGAETAFTTFLGDAEQAKAYMDNMYAFALKTPFAYPDLLESSRNLIAFGVSAQNTMPIMKAVGDAVASIGGGNAEIKNMADIFGQIQSQGRITAMEVNRLAQYGVNAYDILGKAAGMSANEMRKEISKGTVDAGTAIAALVDGMESKFGGAMAGVKGTILGAFDSLKSSLRNAGADMVEPLLGGLTKGIQTVTEMIKQIPSILGPALAAFGPLLDTFNEVFSGDRFTGMINSLSAGLFYIATIFSYTGQVAIEVAGFIADHWNAIAPVLFVVGSMVAALVTVVALVEGATLLWAAAQWVVNSAYLANPVVWVILAVVAVIALVIYAMYAWADATAAAVGYIIGSVLWMGQAFSNVMLWIANIGMATAEWFANTWNQAVFMVQVAWFGLGVFIHSALDLIINGIISAAQVMINIWNDATFGVQMAFHHMASSGLSIMSGLASGVVGVVNSALGAVSNLINTAVGGLNALIGMANKVPGVDIGAIGTVDFKVSNKAGAALGAISRALPAPTRKAPANLGSYSSGKSQGSMPQAPGKVSFDRKEYGSLGDAFDRGFNSGAGAINKGSDKLTGAFDKLSGLFDKPTFDQEAIIGKYDPTNGTGVLPGAGGTAPGGAGKSPGGSKAPGGGKAPGGAGKKGSNPTGGKLDKIGKIDSDINIADEDIKMLRDLADREANRVFITLNPSVNFKDVTIKEEADVDKIINKIEKSMAADVARSVEGVYS